MSWSISRLVLQPAQYTVAAVDRIDTRVIEIGQQFFSSEFQLGVPV